MKPLLTDREKEILLLILEEKTSADIASELNLSVRTIETHRKHIFRKTSCNTPIGLLKFAIKAGMMQDFHYIRSTKHT